MIPILKRGELKQTLCDLNGVNESTEGGPHHFYIILTNEDYNKNSRGFVLAVPYTSKLNEESLNFGINFTNEDIQNSDFVLDKEPSFFCLIGFVELK
jgi:mRNA-degrading endonuclease toxin of MazEF toxin-antitoxin module